MHLVKKAVFGASFLGRRERKNIKRFIHYLTKGFKQELKESIAIPKHIKNKNYDEAIGQVGDIGKMTFLSFLWILPGGGILSGVLVKFSKKIRPSAFREKEEVS